MSETTKPLQNVSDETRNAIARKSAQSLPNRPSEQGYSAEEIKRRLYQPVLDAANSALAEIDRLVNEANDEFSRVNLKFDDFIEFAQIKAPYKSELGENVWEYSEERKRFEFIVTKLMHGIDDVKEIGVRMSLIDGEGKYINVNCYDIFLNGDVRFYNDNQGGGFVSIYRNRDGLIRGDFITDAESIIGLAKVGKTGDYKDLKNKPDDAQIAKNEATISNIISGIQPVGSALFSESVGEAKYAQNAGYATTAGNADIATRATQDDTGANITATYAKKSDVESVGRILFPISSIFMTTSNVNPQTYITGTTWVAWGSGRVPVGVNASDTDFGVSEKFGGNKAAVVVSHTHKTRDLAGEHRHAIENGGAHRHNVYDDAGTGGSYFGFISSYNGAGNNSAPVSTTEAGTHSHTIVANGAHNHEVPEPSGATPTSNTANLQPYITCYMWKRTA